MKKYATLVSTSLVLGLPAYAQSISAAVGSFSGLDSTIEITEPGVSPSSLLGLDISLTNLSAKIDLAVNVVAPTTGPADFTQFQDGFNLAFRLETTDGSLIDFPLTSGFFSLDFSELGNLSDFSSDRDLLSRVEVSGLTASAFFPFESSNGDLTAEALRTYFSNGEDLRLSPIFPSALSVGDPASGFDLDMAFDASFDEFGGDYEVNLAAVPEPANAGILLSLVVTLMALRRRSS